MFKKILKKSTAWMLERSKESSTQIVAGIIVIFLAQRGYDVTVEQVLSVFSSLEGVGTAAGSVLLALAAIKKEK